MSAAPGTRRQWLAILGVVVVLALSVAATQHFLGDRLSPVDIGSAAPDFHARALGGGAVKSLKANFRGQVVLLNIWATWCEPCRDEMPALERLYRAYGAKGLHVVAVSIDDVVGDDSIAAYARNLGLTFEILHDPSQAIDQAYQTTGWPQSFVIGRDGLIRKKRLGPESWDDEGNRALIAELLGISVPPVRVIEDGVSGSASDGRTAGR